jgi:hypothetical protein
MYDKLRAPLLHCARNIFIRKQGERMLQEDPLKGRLKGRYVG